MTLSQRGKVTILPLAAVLMLLFADAAQAWICSAGQKDCNGCINPQTDVNNCGGCKVKCLPCGNGVPSCLAGQCGFTCTAPFMNCDNSWGNGCEVDSTKDVNNCGACGTKCVAPPNASATCNMGKCVYTCNAGRKNCDGKWENGCECAIDSDKGNCGACGAKCKDVANAVSMCQGMKCVYSCKAGWANCDNDWTNGCECAPDSDTNHCGGCGNKCPQPEYYGGEARCTNGKCEKQSCKTGMKYDGGKKCCVNGDKGGVKGGDKGGSKGGDKGGSKGGDKGGSNGGDKGGSKGGSKGGMGGGW